MKKSLIILALTGTLITANAEQASKQSVEKLMELTGTKELAMQTTKQIILQLKPLMPAAPASFWAEFEQGDELLKKLVPIYQNNLGQEEINAAIAFYQTPAGQKFIKAQPKIITETMTAGQQWGQALGQKIMDKYKANNTLKN